MQGVRSCTIVSKSSREAAIKAPSLTYSNLLACRISSQWFVGCPVNWPCCSRGLGFSGW